MPVDKKIVDEQIEALGEFNRWLTGKERNCLHTIISPGETILALTSGFFDNNSWLVAVMTFQ